MSEQKNNGAGTSRPQDKTVMSQPVPGASPLPGMPAPLPAAPQPAPPSAKTMIVGGSGSAAGTPQPQPAIQGPRRPSK